MIPVERLEEPEEFDETVRRPGVDWLAGNPGARRPRPYWDACIGRLRDGFADLCGYAAMLDPTGGTVDHYRSCKNHPHLTYEWSNYRFASGTLNACKKNADDSVLDPYEVRAGWFEILLPSLQMRVTDAVPTEYRERAAYTLNRLRLRDGERVIRWRSSWYRLYRAGELSLEALRKCAPLIADAVVREQGPRQAG